MSYGTCRISKLRQRVRASQSLHFSKERRKPATIHRADKPKQILPDDDYGKVMLVSGLQRVLDAQFPRALRYGEMSQKSFADESTLRTERENDRDAGVHTCPSPPTEVDKKPRRQVGHRESPPPKGQARMAEAARRRECRSPLRRQGSHNLLASARMFHPFEEYITTCLLPPRAYTFKLNSLAHPRPGNVLCRKRADRFNQVVGPSRPWGHASAGCS